MTLDPACGRIDPSDLVQQTLLKAHEKRDQFRGKTDAERAAWLRAILADQIADALRRFGRQGGNPGAIARGGIGAVVGAAGRLAGRRAILPQSEVRPAGAVDRDGGVDRQTAGDQRTALELRHLQGLSVPAAAQRWIKAPRPSLHCSTVR